MALILNIDTALETCSVVLARDAQPLVIKDVAEKNAHSSLLAVLIRDSLAEAGISFSQLDAVAVSKGPGSYTGLRIGTSTAKGLCYALDKPLVSVNTLLSMASHAKNIFTGRQLFPRFFRPLIDARRMEVYTALFDQDINCIEETKALVVKSDSFDREQEEGMVIYFGNGLDKCSGYLKSKINGMMFEGYLHSALGMIPWSEKAYKEQKFESISLFEPYYLKEFVAVKPKVEAKAADS